MFKQNKENVHADILLVCGLNKLDSLRAEAGLYLSVLHRKRTHNNYFLNFILKMISAFDLKLFFFWNSGGWGLHAQQPCGHVIIIQQTVNASQSESGQTGSLGHWGQKKSGGQSASPHLALYGCISGRPGWVTADRPRVSASQRAFVTIQSSVSKVIRGCSFPNPKNYLPHLLFPLPLFPPLLQWCLTGGVLCLDKWQEVVYFFNCWSWPLQLLS